MGEYLRAIKNNSQKMNKVDRPIASVSLDLDNKWAYLKTQGNPAWESFPSYFDIAVPRILNVLNELNLRITFFIVGQDADLASNRKHIRAISEEGHEIANHSFHHEPWLHLYTPEELDQELERTEKLLFEITGHRPAGFRGPGFSLSNETLKCLIRRGYAYDASTFPTFLGPVARAYYFMKTGLSRKEKSERKALFGRLRDGFQSNHPFLWRAADGESLVEIPVTTFPVFKLPIHLSYLVFLSKYSMWLAKFYFGMAIRWARIMGVAPSLLLHPTDFLGAEDENEMAFFPGMDLNANHKIDLVKNVLLALSTQFDVVTMGEHASSVKETIRKSKSVETAVPGRQSELPTVSAGS